jgi:hypothetical protein
MYKLSSSLSIVAFLFSATALAQNSSPAAQDVQRDLNQQQRIEQGLTSGQLNTREAGRLEQQEAHIDQMEKKDLKNGRLSAQEQAQLNTAQNRASQEIYADKHNGTHGNPDASSSKHLQTDIQRNVNQQQRVENGIQNGSLTNHEVGSLERGQAHVNHAESVAATDGHINRAEQAKVQGREDNQSQHIHNKKHNKQQRKQG